MGNQETAPPDLEGIYHTDLNLVILFHQGDQGQGTPKHRVFSSCHLVYCRLPPCALDCTG